MTAPNPAGVGERRLYADDPIQEAVCEFLFVGPAEGWGPTLPGQMFERLRSQYPATPAQQQPVIQAGLSASSVSEAELSFMPVAGPVRLATEDGTRGVQVGPSVLRVDCRRPYPGWESFRESIEGALTTLISILPGQMSIGRMGLRYINQVGLPHGADTDDYFAVYPVYLADMDLTLGGFISRSELVVSNDPNRLLIATFASGAHEVDKSSVILDLDAIRQNMEDVTSVGSAMAIVDELRDIERTAFESAITDQTRKLFGSR